MKRAFSRKNLWEMAPPWLKAGLGRCVGMVPPAYLLGKRFRETLRFVNEAQWWPAERAREYQLDQLRKICTLAYEKTAYYRRTFDAVGFQPGDLKSLSDIRALPTIDKETVRANLDDMMTVPKVSRNLDYVSTGGSSGTTLRFYIGANRSAFEYAYLVSSWSRAGYQLGTPMAVIRGRVLKNGRRHEYDPILRHTYYSNFDMTDDNMAWYLRHIGGLGPCVLHAYPSSAETLALFCKRSGGRMPDNVHGILVESEMVYPGQRQLIENILRVRVFSSYGHCEKLVCAAECEFSQIYHVWPTYGYFELLDSADRPVTSVGRDGEIVGTGFINRVLPFIRYRTDDVATYAGDRCDACRREHVLLSTIKGRWPRGGLIAADGSVISATALNLHDDTFDCVRQYQFYQDEPGKAVLRVVPADPQRPPDRAHIARGFAAKLNGRVQLTIEVCDRIKLTKSGKFNLIDQRIRGVDGRADVRSSVR